MWRFDWPDLVTDVVLDAIEDFDATLPRSEARSLVADVLQHVGGLPVADKKWSIADRGSVAAKLLHEAIGSRFAVRGGRRSLPGTELRVDLVDDNLDEVYIVRRRTDLNSANIDALRELPRIGRALAADIIHTRRCDGPFESIADLARRVDGLGDQAKLDLAGRIEFRWPSDTRILNELGTDLASDFEAYRNLEAPGVSVGVLLERLATAVASHPHPASAAARRRWDLLPTSALGGLEPSSAVEVLDDDRYLPRLIEEIDAVGGGGARIDVAMFYMSWSANHTNQLVVDALGRAVTRGAVVRVMLDKDRPDDPYGSTMINADAALALRAKGIDVRLDAPDRLLHSKCVGLDGSSLIIGSHNWTKSSFEAYHDTSVLVRSVTQAEAWHERFELLWTEADAP